MIVSFTKIRPGVWLGTSNAGLGPTETSEYVGDGSKFRHQCHVGLYEKENL